MFEVCNPPPFCRRGLSEKSDRDAVANARAATDTDAGQKDVLTRQLASRMRFIVRTHN